MHFLLDVNICLMYELSMPDLLEIGGKIKESRKRLRMTQSQLAGKSGVSRARIQEASGALFEDASAIRELEDFFRRVVEP